MRIRAGCPPVALAPAATPARVRRCLPVITTAPVQRGPAGVPRPWQDGPLPVGGDGGVGAGRLPRAAATVLAGASLLNTTMNSLATELVTVFPDSGRV
ncbi:hypothetical protein ACFCYC_24425 [Streptomyces sp. NPDC056402]|uniref:hypothetical protein n=1 Tax=Streptomyces sp. NPDC056402 TaxID=3345810 RepID=UPI0035DEBA08